ncbi:NnrS family protein [Sulfitobacter sp. F26204]|uniref:NnrS family protein n=1 Tax=Sulfitobacter sp. F26204 TaxID=2996014 RepID=UPI00225DD994|nr:NnrS family protein [Sulfitobacter sp. F26204]MCX7560185.1 NnrS family protein [Sulfitobacter sp. F26204]
MAQSTSEQMRQWRGPAVLSFGFRPLFFLAALWAAGAMVAWVLMLSGRFALPTRFDPVTWHAHEFLFGYLGAVIGGFLLTAVPNWTGRLPVVGWSLGGLAFLWVVGRLCVALSLYLSPVSVALGDMAFLLALSLVILREIVVGKNWRNLPVLALIGVFLIANLLFHLQAAEDGFAAQGFAQRLGLAVVLMLISVIGGRIIPSFTRNWLVKRGATTMPAPPMQWFDKACLVVTFAILLLWGFAPLHVVTGALMLILSGLHIARLARWRGLQTLVDPMLWVLHVAYGFLPFGALAMAVSILMPEMLSQAAALHVWTAGTVGLMTVAVMTRATRGHAGEELQADRSTVVIYLALIGSVLLRVCADSFAGVRDHMLHGSALLWCVSFALFLIAYGPMLLRARRERS